MALYSKLGYVGTIWGLLSYVTLLGTAIGTSSMYNQAMPMVEIVDPRSFEFLSSMFGLIWILGIVGLTSGIIAIVSIRKIKPLTKKLPIILILVGIIFMILQFASFAFMTGTIDTIIGEAPYYTQSDYEAENKIRDQLVTSILTSSIPSLILFASAGLAFRTVFFKRG